MAAGAGVEPWDRPGEPLHDPEGLAAFVDAMRVAVPPNVACRELDAHVNDDAFARAALLSNELDLFYGAELRQSMADLRGFDAIVDATHTGVLKPDPRACAMARAARSVRLGGSSRRLDGPRASIDRHGHAAARPPARPLKPPPPLHVVGLGGTNRPGSTTERALVAALETAARAGCSTQLLGAAGMPAELYDPVRPERSDAARTLVDALRRADGLLIATPSYHGGISGLVKNAIDFVEDTRDDAQPYFEGRAVGCIVVADGPQALGSTLASLRAIVHALRGWPTPYAVTLNGRDRPFGDATSPPQAAALDACRLVAMQVVEFAAMSRAVRRSGPVPGDPSATRPEERFP